MYGGKGIGAGGAMATLGASGQELHVLPFTGMNTLELAIAGFVLIAAGQALLRLLPKRPRRRWRNPAG